MHGKLDDAIRKSKSGKYYFKEDVFWPCFYHLKILAYTYAWRTPETVKALAKAIDHLLEFSPLNYPVFTKIRSYYASPCDAFVQAPIEKFDAANVKGAWFDKMELFMRCGIAPYSKYLMNEVARLLETIDENGICQAHMDDRYFKNWGAYSGLKLEENWRTEAKKRCDLTFRALLILHYCEKH